MDCSFFEGSGLDSDSVIDQFRENNAAASAAALVHILALNGVYPARATRRLPENGHARAG